eukprot:CAMPEP_0181185042 /NCGR_PEP_ID=MMETSP1096-20121128/9294_1 /TAXON_ID=156174 ORGANISM="Chrysochromulina ericina, Strain CCMP281" /NCGR_SAMPLE_ID=MMETSP1096 /ASSEMBLY_ACC=CAM_ASM_000453 /LENGTH=105 /DNA_ID=CAMNT_0023273855 /DNA_START=306 /DNA_END=623 /DNA_ORIENTATION=+
MCCRTVCDESSPTERGSESRALTPPQVKLLIDEYARRSHPGCKVLVQYLSISALRVDRKYVGRLRRRVPSGGAVQRPSQLAINARARDRPGVQIVSDDTAEAGGR